MDLRRLLARRTLNSAKVARVVRDTETVAGRCIDEPITALRASAHVGTEAAVEDVEVSNHLAADELGIHDREAHRGLGEVPFGSEVLEDLRVVRKSRSEDGLRRRKRVDRDVLV